MNAVHGQFALNTVAIQGLQSTNPPGFALANTKLVVVNGELPYHVKHPPGARNGHAPLVDTV